MPTYVCDVCEKAFDSKERLREHVETHESEERGIDPFATLRRWKDFLLGLTLRQLAVLIGVVLMATLFAGTAFFYSTISPSTGGGGPSNVQETNPPTGQAVQSVGDIPDIDQGDLPQGYVVRQELSEDMQVHLLYRGGPRGQPAALLQYSCVQCPGVVSNLTAVAQNYQGWVYVAPYRGMNASIAATAPKRVLRLDSFDRGQLDRFICANLQNRPLACAVGGGSTGTAGNGSGG